jgi:hypothetical protein
MHPRQPDWSGVSVVSGFLMMLRTYLRANSVVVPQKLARPAVQVEMGSKSNWHHRCGDLSPAWATGRLNRRFSPVAGRNDQLTHRGKTGPRGRPPVPRLHTFQRGWNHQPVLDFILVWHFCDVPAASPLHGDWKMTHQFLRVTRRVRWRPVVQLSWLIPSISRVYESYINPLGSWSILYHIPQPITSLVD